MSGTGLEAIGSGAVCSVGPRPAGVGSVQHRSAGAGARSDIQGTHRAACSLHPGPAEVGTRALDAACVGGEEVLDRPCMGASTEAWMTWLCKEDPTHGLYR